MMMTFSFYIKKMDNMESTIQRLLETVYAMLARTAELAGSGSARRPGIYPRFLFTEFGITSTNSDLELPVTEEASYEKWESAS